MTADATVPIEVTTVTKTSGTVVLKINEVKVAANGKAKARSGNNDVEWVIDGGQPSSSYSITISREEKDLLVVKSKLDESGRVGGVGDFNV